MKGQHIIQNSAMLRGQGRFKAAIAAITENIDEIDTPLRATAWREAQFAAEELELADLATQFKKRAQVAEAHAKPFFKHTQYGRVWAAWA